MRRALWSGGFGAAVALAAAGLAAAQMPPITSFGTGVLNNQLLQGVDQSRIRAATLYGTRARSASQRFGGGPAAPRIGRPVGPAVGAPTPGPYRRDPRVSADVRRSFTGFVRRAGGPAEAAKVEADFRRFDPVQVWTALVRDNGLRPGTVADALAAWTLLNWAMANGADVDASAARALRDQQSEALGAEPILSGMSEPERQAFAEALMCNYVYQQAALMQASRTGDRRLSAALGDAAERRFRTEMGVSLRAMSLTPRGLLPRG